jgi:hypothetical protein
MKLLCKVMALAVLVTVISPGVLVFGSTQAPPQKPAGCHEHGQKPPTPSPVTYQCCRVGHQIATVREALNLRSRLLSLSRIIEFVVPAAADSNRARQSNPRMLAFSPPAATSLRI